jgi:hypothetical protein
MRNLSKNILLIPALLTSMACETLPEDEFSVATTDPEVEEVEEDEEEEEVEEEVEEEEVEEEEVEEEEEEVEEIREADADFDSIFEPAADVYLGGSASTHSFTYEDEVSFPGGDREDWIRFQTSPNNKSTRRVHLTLNCIDVDGDALKYLRASIFSDQESTGQQVSCLDGTQTFTLEQNTEYDLRIHFIGSVEAAFVHYDVRVED